MEKFLERFHEKDKIEHLKVSLGLFYFFGALGLVSAVNLWGAIVLTLSVGFFKELVLDMFFGSMLKLKGKVFFIGQFNIWDIVFDIIGVIIGLISILIVSLFV